MSFKFQDIKCALDSLVKKSPGQLTQHSERGCGFVGIGREVGGHLFQPFGVGDSSPGDWLASRLGEGVPSSFW